MPSACVLALALLISHPGQLRATACGGVRVPLTPSLAHVWCAGTGRNGGHLLGVPSRLAVRPLRSALLLRARTAVDNGHGVSRRIGGLCSRQRCCSTASLHERASLLHVEPSACEVAAAAAPRESSSARWTAAPKRSQRSRARDQGIGVVQGGLGRKDCARRGSARVASRTNKSGSRV